MLFADKFTALALTAALSSKLLNVHKVPYKISSILHSKQGMHLTERFK